jgi:hypothetical protein
MTGTMHVADHQGDTTHTWDTADPRTVREIEELFREAQASGRLVYRQIGRRQGRTGPPCQLEPRGAHRAVRRPPAGRRLALQP